MLLLLLLLFLVLVLRLRLLWGLTNGLHRNPVGDGEDGLGERLRAWSAQHTIDKAMNTRCG